MDWHSLFTKDALTCLWKHQKLFRDLEEEHSLLLILKQFPETFFILGSLSTTLIQLWLIRWLGFFVQLQKQGVEMIAQLFGE